ncbi:MAG: hypothetical protein WCY32_01605 [Burkholderiaceae bacterium]
MFDTLQRAVARIAAFAAFVFGALVAVFLAAITLAAGLVIGLVATIAAWFGTRRLRKHLSEAARQGGPGTHGGNDGRVIDIEMREIEPGSTDRHEPPTDSKKRAEP